RQVEPEYTPARKVHFYHCDHRGLPLALISEDGNTAWSAEYDEWGNQLNEGKRLVRTVLIFTESSDQLS
ncbi:RHS domain-containing protein, partial [Escherichia coli]|nr:RHS domain-containing protein [Escherichia coli]